MNYELRITIETGERVTVKRVKCYGGEALQAERLHWLRVCPTGGTVTFQERKL